VIKREGSGSGPVIQCADQGSRSGSVLKCLRNTGVNFKDQPLFSGFPFYKDIDYVHSTVNFPENQVCCISACILRYRTLPRNLNMYLNMLCIPRHPCAWHLETFINAMYGFYENIFCNKKLQLRFLIT
jgi:hypothetical protein